MEGPQEKRPVKTFNNLTIRIRNLHGAARQEELRKLNILFQTELLAKQKRAAADLAENRPYVRPKPVKILSIRELQRKSVDVPSDQPFSFVRFHGTFARLKCIRPPVAPPSPPQSPTAHLPPSIPMPEKEAKPLKEIPVLGPGPGQPLQGPPADAPPHEQSVVLEEKPPIQKVVMVRFLEEQSGMPSSSTSLIMQQHDYARPSTSRGTMSQEEIEDIHANFQYEGRNWRNQATYNVTDVRKRKRLEMERRALEQPLPQYRIVQSLNLRPVISQRAKETIVTEAVSSSSDSNYNNIQTRSRIQVINSGLCANRDNDPVSSSSEMADTSRMYEDIKRAKRVLKWCPSADDSDTDDSD